jgi:hypothetical protein
VGRGPRVLPLETEAANLSSPLRTYQLSPYLTNSYDGALAQVRRAVTRSGPDVPATTSGEGCPHGPPAPAGRSAAVRPDRRAGS